MTRVSRLAGAIVVATDVQGEPAWFLVGDTKVPCDWAAAGFERPAERDAKEVRWVRLSTRGEPREQGVAITLGVTGEPAARLVADCLLIERNGAVSDRLWRVIVGEDEDATQDVDARWLGDMPAGVWQIVRDTVLKCT